MPYSILTAPAVQDAYSVNLAPVLSVLQNAQALQLQQAHLAEQRRKELQAARLQGVGLISDAVTPLEKGTGLSPLDELHARQLGDIKAKATEMVMQGGDPAATYMYLQQATNGLRQRQADAVKGDTRVATWAKDVAQKGSGLDYQKVYQQGINNLFYNRDAKGNLAFNPDFDATADFTRGVNLDTAIDPIETQQLAAKELGTLLPSRHSIEVPGQVPGITYAAADEVPSYIIPNAKTGKTEYQTVPLGIKGPDGVERQVPVFSDEVIRTALSGTHTGRYIKSQFREMRAQMPKSVSDDDVARIVATDFIQTHGAKPGGGLKENDEAYKRGRQSEMDQFTKGMQMAHLSLSQQAANRANEYLNLKKQGKIKADQGPDPFTVSALSLGGALTQDPLSQVIAHTNTTTRSLPASTGMDRTPTPMLNYQTLTGKSFFNDPATGQPVQVFEFTAPAAKGQPAQKALAVDYFIKDKKKGYIPDPNRSTKVLTGQRLAQYHFGLRQQMQPTTKRQDENFIEAGQTLDDE